MVDHRHAEGNGTSKPHVEQSWRVSGCIHRGCVVDRDGTFCTVLYAERRQEAPYENIVFPADEESFRNFACASGYQSSDQLVYPRADYCELLYWYSAVYRLHDHRFGLRVDSGDNCIVHQRGALSGTRHCDYACAHCGSGYFSGDALKMVAVWTIVQLIEGKFISPQIMGKTLKIHPITIIFVILTAGNLFGVVGILLAVPGYAVLRFVYRISSNGSRTRRDYMILRIATRRNSLLACVNPYDLLLKSPFWRLFQPNSSMNQKVSLAMLLHEAWIHCKTNPNYYNGYHRSI